MYRSKSTEAFHCPLLQVASALALVPSGGIRRRRPVSPNSRKHLGARLAMSSLQQREMIRIVPRHNSRDRRRTGRIKPLLVMDI